MLSLVWILIIQNNKVLLKMKTKVLLIVLVSVLCSFEALGQTTVVTYSYDAAGNRTSREGATGSQMASFDTGIISPFNLTVEFNLFVRNGIVKSLVTPVNATRKDVKLVSFGDLFQFNRDPYEDKGSSYYLEPDEIRQLLKALMISKDDSCGDNQI